MNSDQPVSSGPPDDAHKLREHGLRVTRPRLAVMELVRENPHADVDAIAGGVRALLGTVSTQAVYDVVRALTEVGLMRKVQPTGSAARYELTPVDDHHHLVCNQCGRIVDVDLDTREAGLVPHDAHGFHLFDTEVTFWGLCPDCRPGEISMPPQQNPSRKERE